RDGDRFVVPAVRVGATAERGRGVGSCRVIRKRERRSADVAGLVLARAVHRTGALVGARIGLRPDAGADPGRPVRSAQGQREYVVCVHVSTPEVVSVPEKPIETAWLYQPFASGFRPALPAAVGGVESYLTGKEVAPTLPALSRHEPVTEALPLSGPT